MYCIFRLPSILTHQHTNLSYIYQAELNQKISIKPSLRLEYVDKEITFIKSDISTDGTPDSPYPQLLSNTPDSVESVKELNFFPNFFSFF